jgi:SAM-dependent methyltransferase
MNDFSYIGTELEVFNHATEWKNYYGKHLRPFLGEEVLEVGAGIGGTTKILCESKQKRWVCLEPDETLAAQIKNQIASGQLPPHCEARAISSTELPAEEKFDSIIYIDVLEHIEEDKKELLTISRHLKKNGFLIILCPAHQKLFTPFDAAIGHFRRYNKRLLTDAAPSNLKCIKLIYLDSVGLLASLGNKLILNSSSPSYKQIQFWDKMLVPISRLTDPISRFRIGKSILGVWQNL